MTDFGPISRRVAVAAVSAVACLALISHSAFAAGKKKRLLEKKPAEAFKELHFKKIKDYKIKLECVSVSRFLMAGDLPKITFSLTNIGKNDLVVYEWFEREPDNLRLYYHVWKKGMDVPPLKEFTPLIPPVEKKPKRMTLELKPKTSVLIDKFLTFVRVVDSKEPVTFIIFAELNLTSISARSGFFKVTVLPRGKK